MGRSPVCLLSRQAVLSHVSQQLGKSEETEYLLDWIQDAWATVDVLVEQFGEEQARKMLEAEKDERKTFREIREQHNITLENLLGDIDRAISTEAIHHFDRTGEGTNFLVDACLDSLSALAGEEYSRENVSGIVELSFLRKEKPRMSEPLTLWMVEAHNASQGELLPLYARDEEHAREQAREWLEERKATHPEQRVHRCPHGYLAGGWTWLPGRRGGDAESQQTGS